MNNRRDSSNFKINYVSDLCSSVCSASVNLVNGSYQIGHESNCCYLCSDETLCISYYWVYYCSLRFKKGKETITHLRRPTMRRCIFIQGVFFSSLPLEFLITPPIFKFF